MTLTRQFAAVAALAILAACGTTDRIAVKPPVISETVRIGFNSVEVKEVSLPSYAAADELATQAPDGMLLTSKILWADAPERAISLELSRNLARLTGARIAARPWPFEENASATLDVRFVELVAGTDGRYSATGQYFVGVVEGRERDGLFDLSVAYDPEGAPASIAQARGQIILDLARFLAREALR